MKLGDVLKKERENKDLKVAEIASRLGISEEDYQSMEAGESDAETWGPRLALIAIALETPTSRLLAESGRAEDTKAGQAGQLIAQHRERREKSVEAMAEAVEISVEEYAAIEKGESPIEVMGPRLLALAEAIEQPIFNLFYPCGLPFSELDDYP